MNISSLNIFSNQDQIAWIGGGGKTSLIFTIAKELFSEKCVITTTTKMGINEKELANKSYSFDEGNIPDFPSLNGISFIYKRIHRDEQNKVIGLDSNLLKELSIQLHNENIPLFIEADGSKQKPIKMHAEHEPVIPDFVNKVCVVVGLSAIGKTLDQENFHRPELISDLLQIPIGSQFEWQHLFELLSNENGYIKKIPKHAKKVLFFHQADVLNDHSELKNLVLKLKNHYHDILLSSIKGDSLTIHAHWGPLSCAIIAAGGSTRFGSAKQLAIYNQKTFIENVIDTALKIKFSEVSVVLGANFEKIHPIINHYPIRIIQNTQWEKGQSTSVSQSVAHLSKGDSDGIIFLVVDQPQLKVELIENVIHKFAYEKNDVIVHSYDNQNRHPILFSRSTFGDLLRIDGEKGGRQLFEKYPPAKIPILDPYFALDVDRVEDLIELEDSEGNHD